MYSGGQKSLDKDDYFKEIHKWWVDSNFSWNHVIGWWKNLCTTTNWLHEGSRVYSKFKIMDRYTDSSFLLGIQILSHEARKPHLPVKNVKDRMRFCRKYRHWTSEIWSKIFFWGKITIPQFTTAPDLARVLLVHDIKRATVFHRWSTIRVFWYGAPCLNQG